MMTWMTIYPTLARVRLILRELQAEHQTAAGRLRRSRDGQRAVTEAC